MATPLAKGTITKALALVAVVGVVIALVIVALPSQNKKYLTASFPRTVSLYEGSDVRILGVPVGKVESVVPSGTDVTVKMWYDAKYKVPKNAKAVIISPAIVGDRFVQLTPVYHSGATLADNAVLTTKDTSTPLELDSIYSSIDKLTVALGPGGANKEGSLTRLLNSTAANFQGQGEQFHQTIQNLGRFTGTLDNNKEALFGTVRQIERFVNALAKNDTTVRRFNDSLTSAASLLKDERGDLRASLHNLGIAMRAVQGFVQENRATLSHNIKGLNRVSKVLVKQRAAVDQILRIAPTALANLFHTYNPSAGTLDTRTNINQTVNGITADPAKFLCSMLQQGGASKSQSDAACKALAALPKPRAGALAPTSGGGSGTRQVELVDRSLGGILGGQR